MVKTLKQLKTKLVNFKVPEELGEQLQKLADKYEEGNVSVYLRKLIAREFEKEPVVHRLPEVQLDKDYR